MARHVENIAWCLPRPRRDNKYPGGFPAHFEKKLISEMNKLLPEDSHAIRRVLHPFGGQAEYGLRVDVKLEVRPDVLADAHRLPFQDETFDAVILDPPYDDHYSKLLYKTFTEIRVAQAMKEAVRVTKTGGYVVMYHALSFPVPAHCLLAQRILVETRPYHTARIVHIYVKDAEAYHTKGRALGRKCLLCKAIGTQPAMAGLV